VAVVINELEVTPQPTTEAGGGQQAPEKQGAASASPEAVKAMEKTLHKKYQRSYRLETY
jgi:hypothetical protein